MELIDTHCQLFRNPLARDVEGVRARAGEAGVREVVVPAHDRVSWDAIRELGRLEGVHPALGLHPAAAGQVAIKADPTSRQPPLILRGRRGPPGQRTPSRRQMIASPRPWVSFGTASPPGCRSAGPSRSVRSASTSPTSGRRPPPSSPSCGCSSSWRWISTCR